MHCQNFEYEDYVLIRIEILACDYYKVLPPGCSRNFTTIRWKDILCPLPQGKKTIVPKSFQIYNHYHNCFGKPFSELQKQPKISHDDPWLAKCQEVQKVCIVTYHQMCLPTGMLVGEDLYLMNLN